MREDSINSPAGSKAFLSLLKDVSISSYYPWAIFFIALVVRLIHIATLKEGFYFSDFIAYDGAAVSLLQGHGFGLEYSRPPLYPVFLAANYFLFGHHICAVRIVQAVMGAFSSVLLFKLTDDLLGRKAAHVTAWISVFYPYYIFIAGLEYPTLVTSFLLICVIYLLQISIKKNSFVHVALAALCLGMAALAVPVSLAFLPFLLLWFLLISRWDMKRKILSSAVSVVVVAGCLLPWTLYCYNEFGKFVLVDPRAAKHLPVVAQGESISTGKRVSSDQRLDLIMTHPGKFLLNVGGEFIRFWKFVPDRVVTKDVNVRMEYHEKDQRMVVDNPYVSSLMDWVSILTYGPVFLLALVGIVLCWDSWYALSLPFLLLLSHALGYSLFFSQTRYRLPVEFCLMILAGGGAVTLWGKLSGKNRTA